MRSTLALLALASSAAAQAVTNIIVPSATPPAGCDNSRSGTFQIAVFNASTPVPSASPHIANDLSSKSSLVQLRSAKGADLFSRQNGGSLTISLSGGMLHDQNGRTGYIASNYQFQFDKPPQAGAIYTGGFTVCANNSLALGGSAIFWQCLSGTFFNLYDRDWATQCKPVYINAVGSGSPFSTTPPGPVSTGPNQATIKNGGGTQSMSLDTTSVGFGVGSSTMSATGTAAASASGTNSGTAGAAPASSSSAAGAAAVVATEAPKALLPWALGVVGALALV